VKLLYGLKDGSLSSSKSRARCSKWLQYLLYSTKSKTLKVVILTHFQLSSSVTKCFPTLIELGLSTAATATAAVGQVTLQTNTGINVTLHDVPFQAVAQGASSTEGEAGTFVTDEIMRVGNEFAGAVGDIDFSFLEFTNCLTGPRHYDRLVAKTFATLAALMVAWYVPELVRLAATRCTTCVSVAKRESLRTFYETARSVPVWCVCGVECTHNTAVTWLC
jgi:hypothetical protein